MKNKRGITLIALVITIIVLLILAGVSITSIVKDDGIIEKAKQAKEETKLKQEKEENELNDYVDVIEDSLHPLSIEYILFKNDSLAARLTGDFYHLSPEEYVKEVVKVRSEEQLKEEFLQNIFLNGGYKANITWEEYLAQEAITEEKFITINESSSLKEALAKNELEYVWYLLTGKIEGMHDVKWMKNILVNLSEFSDFEAFVKYSDSSSVENYNDILSKSRNEETLLKGALIRNLAYNKSFLIEKSLDDSNKTINVFNSHHKEAHDGKNYTIHEGLINERNYILKVLYMGKIISQKVSPCIEYSMHSRRLSVGLLGAYNHLSFEKYASEAAKVRSEEQLKEEFLQSITLNSRDYKANITWEEFLTQEAITEEEFITINESSSLKEALAKNEMEYNFYISTGKIEGVKNNELLKNLIAKLCNFPNFEAFEAFIEKKVRNKI